MIIDMFTHVSPVKYNMSLYKMCSSRGMRDPAGQPPTALTDPDVRYTSIAELGDMKQVLTLGQPPIEVAADSQKAVALAKLANDAVAEFTARHPDKFIGTASLPMNNMDAALKELDRAINTLKLKGVQIYTNVNGKPLDSPEFLPFYEQMVRYDLPVWIHPLRDSSEPDYPVEENSKYNLTQLLGWPYATSMAMARLAASGVLERYPNIKFITHHSGGVIPYLAQRIERSPFKFEKLHQPAINSLRLFYNDTAVQGNLANLMCAYAFCGAGHMVFGTDYGMASPDMVKLTVKTINEMAITDGEKQKIFSENAVRLLKL